MGTNYSDNIRGEQEMTTYNEELQRIFREYEHKHEHAPTSSRVVVEWAVANGELQLPEIDPLDVLAGQMSRALREEYATDQDGLRYRVNHAVRITKDGAQHTFWGIMGFAQRTHMEKAFTQRRENIIGDCLQLQIDVEVYNKMNADAV